MVRFQFFYLVVFCCSLSCSLELRLQFGFNSVVFGILTSEECVLLLLLLHGQGERGWDKKIISTKIQKRKILLKKNGVVRRWQRSQISFTRFSLYMEFYLSDLDICGYYIESIIYMKMQQYLCNQLYRVVNSSNLVSLPRPSSALIYCPL